MSLCLQGRRRQSPSAPLYQTAGYWLSLRSGLVPSLLFVANVPPMVVVVYLHAVAHLNGKIVQLRERTA